MSSDNFVDSSFGRRGKPQDMSSPSNSEKTYGRLVRRCRVVPQVSQDEISWVRSTM